MPTRTRSAPRTSRASGRALRCRITGTGSLSDGVISTSNETLISDISNQTITLTNDMAASTSGSVTTAQSKLTADVLVNALQGNVKGVYEEVFGTYKLVATNPYPVVTSAMYVGVDTNKGMVYYKIALPTPRPCDHHRPDHHCRHRHRS